MKLGPEQMGSVCQSGNLVWFQLGKKKVSEEEFDESKCQTQQILHLHKA